MAEEKIEVKDCKHGKGIFATRDIKKGEEVLIFKGEIINFEQSQDPEVECYCVQNGKDSYIKTAVPEKFINHSCSPNSGFKNPRTLAAIRDIKKGEEITFDYSTGMDEDSWTMKCECGNENCRKIIKDFKYLPKNIQEHYIKLGIVPQWVLDSISLKIQMPNPKNKNI